MGTKTTTEQIFGRPTKPKVIPIWVVRHSVSIDGRRYEVIPDYSPDMTWPARFKHCTLHRAWVSVAPVK